MIAAYVFVIIGLVGFLVFTAVKAWKYSHMPVHSRVDLYPVPGEGNGRGAYGGSYFENVNWWERPRPHNFMAEVWYIAKEMLFILRMFENQRSLWWASYAFHLGIYVMFGWSILMGISVILYPAPEFWIIGCNIVGGVGFALATLGAILLLIRRCTTDELRKYTTPQEYFNLLLILVTLLTGIASWLTAADPFEVAHDVFTLNASAELPALVVVHLVLVGITLLYIPLTKMSHYIGKFFAFHKVSWDNEPNKADSHVAQAMRREAELGVVKNEWAAPHTHTDGPEK